jgi:hypothetical protein
MPISGLALSRTNRQFTDHLKNFELGTITETNPSDGVYRYTFADGTSPYTWGEVAKARGIGEDATPYGTRFGINVGYTQYSNNTGATNYFDAGSVNMHYVYSDPKVDSISSTLSPFAWNRLPFGRNTETTGTFASYLGGSAATVGVGYAEGYQPGASRLSSNSPITLNTNDRYIEINWNQVALNETTYTTFQRSFGRTVAGNVKIIFQPYIYFDNLTPSTDFAVYYGKPRYYNSTIAGASLATLRSSPPSDITSFNYPGGRTIGWTETNANAASPYIYAYKWNGASWSYLREGLISDQHVNYTNTLTKAANYNTYTFPAGDGTSTYFYIFIYQYDGYYNTFSGGQSSNFITV